MPQGSGHPGATGQGYSPWPPCDRCGIRGEVRFSEQLGERVCERCYTRGTVSLPRRVLRRIGWRLGVWR